MGYPFNVSGISSFLQDLPIPVKIIAILRDPIDRIASHYTTKALYPAVLTEEPDFLRELLISDYWLQLSQFWFFRENGGLHLISFPDLVLDQKGVLSRVCKFLGLDPDVTDDWLRSLSLMRANKSLDTKNAMTLIRNHSSVQLFKAGIPLSIKKFYKQLERDLPFSWVSEWKPDFASVERIRFVLKPSMNRLHQDFGIQPKSFLGSDWFN